MEKNRKNSLFNSAVLALGIVFSKILGAIYKIPLIGVLGADGIGRYQQIFSVYAFLLTVVSGAISTAVARLVGEKEALENHTQSVSCYKGAKYLTFILGSGAAVLTLLLAYPLSLAQKAQNTLGYIAIAPSLIFASMTAAVRGFFQGKKQIFETTFSQLLEQAFKILFGITLAKILLKKGIDYAVFGSLLGVTLSEIIAFAYLDVKAHFSIKHYPRSKADLKQVMSTGIKMNFSAAITPALLLTDGLLVVWLLTSFNNTPSPSGAYGLMAGVAHTVVNVPTVIILSLPVALTPFLSEAKAKRNIDSIQKKTRDNLTISYVASVFFTLFVGIFSRSVISFLFPTLSINEIISASKLLVIMSVGQIFVIDLQFRSSLLQALGVTDKPLKILIVTALFKLIFTIPLTYRYGIYGAAASTIFGYALGDILMANCYVSYLGKDKRLTLSTAKILLSGVVTFAILFSVKGFISNNLIKLVVYGIFGGAIYLSLLKLLGVIPRFSIKKAT